MDVVGSDKTELCYIDAGIDSLYNVPLYQNITSLNLHSNHLQTIENLHRLSALKHLDLSSNQIYRIEGLDALQNLCTLNVSCNKIARVEGLSNLRNLVKINLSFNQITDVSGFSALCGPAYKLSTVTLHGNYIEDISALCENLTRCTSLRILILRQEGVDNPLCQIESYRTQVLASLPQLNLLDNHSRTGHTGPQGDIMIDVPGLEDFLDYLSTGNSMKEPQTLRLVTPQIDKVLDQYRNKATFIPEHTVLTSPSAEAPTTPSLHLSRKSTTGAHVAKSPVRMSMMENANSSLESACISGQSSTQKSSMDEVPSKDTDVIELIDSGTDSQSGTSNKQRRRKKSHLPSYRKSTAASRARKEETQAGYRESDEENDSQRTIRSRSPSPGRHHLSLRVMNLEDTQSRVDAQREEIHSTYVNLMKELELERERRWKAEQAAKKLAEHIKEIQSRARGEQSVQDSAFQATSRLKQNLSNERNIKLGLKTRVQELEEEVSRLSSQLSSVREIEESSRRSQQTLEETLAKTEAERVQQHTHESKKTLDAQMKSAAMSRELDIMKNTVASQKSQIHSLQELLASREQEYRDELKHRYTRDSPEMQTVLDKELKRAEEIHHTQISVMQEKLSQLNHEYAQLEDEFRMALQIEANRFHKVQDAYEVVSQSNAENKRALFAAQEKEKKTDLMICEMTALVREQKGRITELSKSKHEQLTEYRERVNKLEAHVEEARKRMLEMELLKQENKKMKAQVDAQESVIEGLRSERKIWGQELTQQGVSLAQDRGRLEAKIETQTSEMAVLRKYLEKETDAVKIKAKMIEDQTESIRKLKQALLEAECEVKKARSESLDLQKQLEDQLAEDRTAYQQAQEVIDRLRSRKEEIKQQLDDTNTELHEAHKAHSLLNTRWKEKSELIGQLEQQVMQMKASWESKETKLTEERDKAIEMVRVGADKLRNLDDSFRTQLEAKEKAHQEKITLIIQKKQAEIDNAQQRINRVENEMRELLCETEVNKRLMEEKVKRLTKAFSEIQADLS